MYQDLSTRHDWPVKKAIVNLPVRLKENSNVYSGHSLSLLGAQNKDISACSQTLCTYQCKAGGGEAGHGVGI